METSLVGKKAYHLIYYSIGVDKFSDSFVCVFFKEHFCGFCMKNDYFSPLTDIDVIDKSPPCRFYSFYILMIRVYSFQCGGYIVLSIC